MSDPNGNERNALRPKVRSALPFFFLSAVFVYRLYFAEQRTLLLILLLIIILFYHCKDKYLNYLFIIFCFNLRKKKQDPR